MAEPQEEEIIIIEDSDAANEAMGDDDSLDVDEGAKRKKILIFGGIAVGVVLIIVIVILLVLSRSSKEEQLKDVPDFNTQFKKKKVKKVEPSKLENMIAKANYLYSNGSKQKALQLYEQIALYSEAISLYNLGVAQMKNNQYKIAKKTFQKAIENNEKRCVSAINAAVCALHLNEKDEFRYYLDLAYAYLPNEIDSPLYSYYYTLINYYNKNYISTLSSLKHSTITTDKNYNVIQNYLRAKIDAMYLNNYDAIEAMEKINGDLDDFSLGLLYARVGDYTLALSHLDDAVVKNIEPTKAKLAIAMINLKAGHVRRATHNYKELKDNYPSNIYDNYPIKVKLRDSLFDAKKAQKFYRETTLYQQNTIYSKIFYFSPYKIFNANQTISYIRKGNANTYIDNIKTAQKYLKKSSSSSSVNVGITRAIKDALSMKIRQANEELQKLVKIQPRHSILQYNLALTYAQMGDIAKAHEHFLRSYYLDSKNYLSGIYAIMTSQLMNKDYKKLKSILSDSIENEEDSEDVELYKTLLRISQNDYISAASWLDNTYKERPLYLMLDIIISYKLNKYEIAKKAAQKLTILLPHDILPHIEYIDTHFYKYKELKYAEVVAKYLKEQKFNFNDLYYGPYITRYLYVQQNLITGRLYYLREQLKKELETKDTYTQELESTLALASLFDGKFEESYTIYNHIIDELKVQDPYTLYIGAVASTAAGHHGNAIALLELSKLKDKSFYESRFALALLYLEIGNVGGAVVELSRIDLDDFRSKYFDFEIDTDKLLFQKQQKELH